MAEAVTYADLRFVKAPLKKSVSIRLGHDQEDYEDGELTYENVQVPSAPEWPAGMAHPGLGDKAEVLPEQPAAAWSAVTSAANGRVLPCCAGYTHLLFLGLLLTCLLLGVAAICLGVRYLQVSHQLQQTGEVLVTTNSSLHQKLHQQITQVGKRDEELQGSRRKLAESQKDLQSEQEHRQSVERQFEACQSDKANIEENLQREERQRSTLEERLGSVRNTLKPFFLCSSPEACCPVGWTQMRGKCFYVSLTRRSWEQSQMYCKTLSSDLALNKGTQSQPYLVTYELKEILNQLSSNGELFDSCWTGPNTDKNLKWSDSSSFSGYPVYLKCTKVMTQKKYWFKAQDWCSVTLPCICEMTAFSFPDEHSSYL